MLSARRSAPIRASERALLQAFAGLANERDGLGEDCRDDGANLLGLRFRVALHVQPVDRGDGHVDRELDRVVGPRESLLALHLLRELSETPLKILGVAKEIAEATGLHATIVAPRP